LIRSVRKAGIASEIFPESCKIKKQMSYANIRNIPFVAIAGETELNTNSITLKDMKSGKQFTIPVSELVSILKTQIL